MLSSSDLKGVMGMMPAFTTPDGDSVRATNTINVDELQRGVDKAIRDGIGVITTTGSFGECHTLLWDEFVTLAEATVEAVNKRVPVMIGTTSLNTREVIKKLEVVSRLGADGSLIGVPHYFPPSVDNAVQFYFDIADAFPDLGIMIYHNPRNHYITIPVQAFKKLVTKPNIVGMKDSHRTPMAFMNLMEIIKGKISVFTNQNQLFPYMMMGAAGCWSINAWMGPSVVVRAAEAAMAGDWETTKEICMAMANMQGGDAEIDPAAGKLAINEAGYVNAGPPRPPFRVVSDQAREGAKESARKWVALCQRYPLTQKATAAA